MNQTLQFVFQDVCLAYVAEVCIDPAFASSLDGVGKEPSIHLRVLAKISQNDLSGIY
jgi:hypothetical protein